MCLGNTVHKAFHEHPDQPEFKSADMVVFGPSVLCVDERDAMMGLMGWKAQSRCAWDNQKLHHTRAHTYTRERALLLKWGSRVKHGVCLITPPGLRHDTLDDFFFFGHIVQQAYRKLFFLIPWWNRAFYLLIYFIIIIHLQRWLLLKYNSSLICVLKLGCVSMFGLVLFLFKWGCKRSNHFSSYFFCL